MSFKAISDSYSILEDIYYKYVPVSDTLRFIAISDYIGLDSSCKTPENKDISSFNSRDVFSLSDSQMDRIATRLASGAFYRSERNAIVVLLEQIRQEIKR